MVIVVSDTSAIAALCHLELSEILRSFYSEVIVPPTVAVELKQPRGRRPSVDVKQLSFVSIRAPQDAARVAELERDLESGKSEAIALAIELSADWILIDEELGRRVASRLGLRTTDVLGILLRAKGEGVVPAICPLIDRLVNEIDFRILTGAARSRVAASRRVTSNPSLNGFNRSRGGVGGRLETLDRLLVAVTFLAAIGSGLASIRP